MKRFLLAFITILVPVVGYGAGMVISPVQLGLVGPPRSTVSGVINVSSPRPQENTVRVTFGDYTIDEEGKRTEVSAGDAGGRSCLTWLDVDQHQFVSPERGLVAVVISAKIPADASGSYWAEAYFQSVPPPPSFAPGGRAPSVGVRILPRIGIPIIVTAKGTETYGLKVNKLDAFRTSEGFQTSVLLENTGNAAVLVSGAVALERPSPSNVPEELASKDVELVTSYPGAKRLIKVLLPAQTVDASTELHAYLQFGPGPERAVEAAAKMQALLDTHAETSASRQ